MRASTPVLSLTYRDPPTGTRGYLVIDRLIGGLAAGGLRIRERTSADELAQLARNMTLKQAAVGIEVGGAKAGIDMAPDAPDRAVVLRRFIAAISPFIGHCFNCGPDVNTTMAELETIGAGLGLPCLKIAVARRRGVPDDLFLRRYALFEELTPLGTVNQLRAPTAVKAAALCLLERAGVAPREAAIAIQGAGSMGGGTAALLHAAGARVTMWSDDEKCLVDPDGLNVPELLAARTGGRLPGRPGARACGDLFDGRCDLLVLAAVSHAMSIAQARDARCRGVVVAANLGLDDETERTLAERGVPVVPDLLASAGGSLAVESLYAASPSCGGDVLAHVDARIRACTARWIGPASAARRPIRELVLEELARTRPEIVA